MHIREIREVIVTQKATLLALAELKLQSNTTLNIVDKIEIHCSYQSLHKA